MNDVTGGDDGIVELSREEGIALFDKATRSKLGISGEEFLRRFDAGEYDCGTGNCSPDAFKLAMLIPFARQEPGGVEALTCGSALERELAEETGTP